MKTHTFLLVLLIFITQSIFSQQSEQLKYVLDKDISKEYKFDQQDLKQEMVIYISKDVKDLFFRISGKITQGQYEIKILDPNNKHEGTFELKTESNKNSMANGNFHKSCDNPIGGNWIIRIEVQEVKGDLSIEVSKG